MTEPPSVEPSGRPGGQSIGMGARERRWLLGFLVLGSLYFASLLAERVIGLLGGFASILLVVFLAWLLAFVMAPLVGWLEDRLNAPRGPIVVATYLAALVVFGFLLFYIAAALTQQIAQLARSYPDTEQEILAVLGDWQRNLRFGRLEIDLTELYAGAISQLETIGLEILDSAESIAGVTIAAVGSFLLIIVLSLYMLMDSTRILSRLRGVVPRRYSDEADLFERTTIRAFGGFLRAQIILAAVQGTLVAVVGTLFGIPYLFLWGTVSALLMLIPFFGPPLALIPPVVATVIFAPEWALLVVPVLLISQTVLVNYLQPRLMREALGMHPILVLVGLLVGAQVAGVWGALFGIPVIAVLNVFFNYAVNLRTLEETAIPADEVLDEVRREVPDAETEEIVALAADRIEESQEAAEAAEAAAASGDAVSDDLRIAAGDLRAAADEQRSAAGEMGDSASGLREAVERLNEETRGDS
jgi:predicted PurR-regulated permease PerM